MDNSVYFGHLFNSNESINHSGDVRDGGEYETIFCNLDSVPLYVNALYFLLTVATPGKTLKDVNNAFVKVLDTKTGASLCQCSPHIAGERTSMLLMRITRCSENWNVSLIDDMNSTAKEFGGLIQAEVNDAKTLPGSIEANAMEFKNSKLESKTLENTNEENEQNESDLKKGKLQVMTTK